MSRFVFLFEYKGSVNEICRSPKSIIGRVVSTSDVDVAFKALPLVPAALLSKEICDFLATLYVANPGSNKTIGCLLNKMVIRDKKRGGVSP